MVGDAKYHLHALERYHSGMILDSSHRFNDSLPLGSQLWVAVIWQLLAQHKSHKVESKGRMNAMPFATVMTAQSRSISLYATQLLVSYSLSFVSSFSSFWSFSFLLRR